MDVKSDRGTRLLSANQLKSSGLDITRLTLADCHFAVPQSRAGLLSASIIKHDQLEQLDITHVLYRTRDRIARSNDRPCVGF